MINTILNILKDIYTYRQLTLIKEGVDKRIIYNNNGQSMGQLPDWTYVPKGGVGHGDCTCYAETYQQDCFNNNIFAQTQLVMVGDVEHAVCKVGKYSLDNRFKKPILFTQGGYGMWKPSKQKKEG